MIVNMIDDFENKLEVLNGQIFLTLKSENKTRNIGEYKEGNHTYYYYKYVKRSNIMLINDSVGFNWEIIDDLDSNSGCVITIENLGSYCIKKLDMIEHGSFLHFNTQGFERQFFVPIDKMKELPRC